MRNRIFLTALIVVCCLQAAHAQLYRNEWIDYSKTYYKFKIGKTGLYRISKTQLDGLGIGSANAAHFQLWRNGTEVPLYTTEQSGPLSAGGYIEFWGEKNDGKLDNDLYLNPSYQANDQFSLFTDSASFFLLVNPGPANKRLVPQVNSITSTMPLADSFFMRNTPSELRDQLFQGNFIEISGEQIRSSSFDKGEGWCTTWGAQNNNNTAGDFAVPNFFNNGPDLSYTVSGIGGTYRNRRLRSYIGGIFVDSTNLSLIENKEVRVNNIPKSVVNNDKVPVMVRSSLADNSGFDIVYLAKFFMTYPSKFNFDNEKNFEFTLPANTNGNYLKIINFNEGAALPILYDLTNGGRYVGVMDNDTVKIMLQPSATERKLLLVNGEVSNTGTVANIRQRVFTNITQPANQGDFIIVSNPVLYDYAGANYVESYRQYRSSAAGGNYAAKVYDIEDVNDQFAYGINNHPIGIRNLLRYGRANFTQKPKFAFLIGRAVTYNAAYGKESDATIRSLNLVPTWGNPASDNLFGAAVNNNTTPVTPVGRLSAVNGKEVGDYLEKVREYEQRQANPSNSIAVKNFSKQVLHLIGTSDASVGNIITGYMDNYKKILSDTLAGADVHQYSKLDNNDINQSTTDISNRIDSGVTLITYFGHSSASSLDFNLNDPNDYKNDNGKYPVFIANGCNAGNFYTADASRLANSNLSLSEKFVLAKQRGSVAFIASTHFGVLNFLDVLTDSWYKAASSSRYGKSIGEIHAKAIEDNIANAGASEYYNRLNCEEATIHGDPSLKVFLATKPDYVVEAPYVTFNPGFISTADDSFNVRTVVYNVGQAVKDSVVFLVQRKYPNNTTKTIFTVKRPAIKYNDTISFNVPVIGNIEKGTNQLIVTIDPANLIQEVSESNNSVTVPFEVSDLEIRPVYPYNLSIVNNTSFKLSGSTANPFAPLRTYRLQMDTTDLFNSPLLASKDTTSTGGVVSFNPITTLQDGKVYYWRIAPVVSSSPVNWRKASFVYLPASSAGFNQSHYFQDKQSSYKGILLDTTTRALRFDSISNNLFITHSIYGTSGTENSHFSISVNGDLKIQTTCSGHALLFNVFDGKTFASMVNPGGGFMGSAGPCGGPADILITKYTFSWDDRSSANRKQMMDFMDYIPDGSYVVVRKILDAPYANETFAGTMRADTAIYGSGNSLYHKLKAAGFSQLDSYTYPRTFAFVYRKGDTTNFRPQVRMSDGLYDRVVMSVDAKSVSSKGEITSPLFGPAKGWNDVHWRGRYLDSTVNGGNTTYNDSTRVDVIGYAPNGASTLLYSLNKSQKDFDISAVSAAAYPYIQLKMYNLDTVTFTPYQLDYWRLNYQPVPEGALAPNLYFQTQDTVFASSSIPLKFGVAFKNVSETNFDSLKLQLKLYNLDNGSAANINLPKARPVVAGDTVRIYFEMGIDTLLGNYNIYLNVNPNMAQPEQTLSNNFLYRNLFVWNAILPVTLVDFTAVKDDNSVLLQWQATRETNLAWYEVEHSTDGRSFASIGRVAGRNNGALLSGYDLRHAKPATGVNYYRLRMVDNNGTVKYSPIRQVYFGKGAFVQAYPNPFNDMLKLNLSGEQRTVTVTLTNAAGQKLWQQQVNASTSIDTRKLSSGSYWLIVTDGKDQQQFKLEKL